MIRISRIHGFERPLKSDLDFLRNWLDRPDGGDLFLEGVEADQWEEHYSGDLVAVGQHREQDRFAQYLSNKIIPFYHRHFGCHKRPGHSGEWDTVWEYESEIFVALGNTICTVLSSLIPVTSICALYFLKNTIIRLAVITTMSFVFSFVMTVIVQGRRTDVFAATTAFAAVQVVFVAGFTAV